ncbi:MAG TPA: glycoside hydrolase family 3 N-terminal domain-containing protein [Terriglobia bacterium]|nr:glycoside hydrolase family 3 N-terminal domain-containing protein [Terriglobia bacterium]
MLRKTSTCYPFLAAIVLVFLCQATKLAAQNAGAALTDPAIEARVNALLEQMTLEEKVGQLNQRDAFAGVTGLGEGGSRWDDAAAKGAIGSLFNMTKASMINAVQKSAVEKSRLHIPVLFGLDVIHGFRTTFPVPLGMSAAWNPQLVERASRIAAEEASAAGVRWTFSPMVDIARDARWGRIVEGAGEDPYLGSVMAAAYVRGYQGKQLDSPDSIAACVKHYVAYGAAEGGRDYNTTEMSERTLRQVYLPPFHAAVETGAATLMSAFNALNGVPASANHFTLTEVLKQEWKFPGFVVSDYGSIRELIPHGIANDGATAARKAFLAGVDMDMEDHLYDSLVDQVKSGSVPQAAIDEAVRRILRVKFALGLFDRPYVKETPRAAQIKPEYRETARTIAEQSLVLLKNDGVAGGTPILPLTSKVTAIALIGPLADAARDMLGAWSTFESSPTDVVTLRAALDDYAKQRPISITYAKGTDVWGDSEAGFAEAVEAARKADVAVLALGEEAWSSGEAGSRAHLNLPGNQEKLLDAVAATGKPVVVVLFNGHPLTLTSALPHMAALLEAWFPGIEAGPAIVRTLFGDANPSGRLTVSFPRSVGQEPLYYNALPTGRPAGNLDLTHPPQNFGERFFSRYIDEQNSPLFPFGFGLSYTIFSFSPLTLSAKQLSAAALNAGSAEPLRVSAEVKNTGDRGGDETVQFYIREQGTSVARPVRELKGFQRISLGAGESKRVEFTLGRDELRFWNIDMKDVVEPAKVTVWIGPSSVEGSEAELQVTP